MILDLFSQGPIFAQGGLTISFPSNVLASVSVKTRYTKANVKDATSGLVGQPVLFQYAPERTPWLGSFFFEPQDVDDADRLCSDVAEVIAGYAPFHDDWTGTEYCLRAGRHAFARVLVRDGRINVDAYAPFEDATAVFLARLLDHVSHARGSERSDFADYVDEAVGSVDGHAHKDLAAA